MHLQYMFIYDICKYYNIHIIYIYAAPQVTTKQTPQKSFGKTQPNSFPTFKFIHLTKGRSVPMLGVFAAASAELFTRDLDGFRVLKI